MSLFKRLNLTQTTHNLAANINPLNHHKILLTSLTLLLSTLTSSIQPAQAEGSRTLYPTNLAGASRANLEWRTDSYANIVRRRTLLKVYANAGEHILLGSSAVGQGSGDILVYDPGQVTGSIGSENIPGIPNFRCTTDQPGRGQITSRALELAGPRSITGGGNPTGYIPCFYQAPSTGVYDVVFYGPAGGNNGSDGVPTGELSLTSTTNFDTAQGSSVAAWDVTVRSSTTTSTTDINGRLFAYYLALFTGGNLRPVYFDIYPVTIDGYRYQVTLRGLDPNGFVIYGNQVGFFDSDGTSILYRNVLASNSGIPGNQLIGLVGGTSLSRPQYPTFFNRLDPTALSSINRYLGNGNLDGVGIPLAAEPGTVNGFGFSGTLTNNNSQFTTGGAFTFTNDRIGNYQIIISQDGIDFDPTKSTNRAINGYFLTTGTQTVNWNGRDNSGNFFPIGINYRSRIRIHSGEYHFPMLDAENNFFGGPTITLLNSPDAGKTTGFYDDRGYTTIGGTNVGTPGSGLCPPANSANQNPPNPLFSDPINGFNTASNQRAFGQDTAGNSAGNTGTPCTGAFGDTKGLDIWTYSFTNAAEVLLNILGDPRLLMVKRITAINGVPINQYVDDPNSTDDNNTNNWPTPLNIYLRGRIDGGTVKPGDEIEYTIYFLSSGTTPITNINFCDLVPENTTFLPTSFNGNIVNSTDRDGGLTTADYGMMLQIGSTTPTIKYLSNIVDSPDRGRYLTPGTEIPTTFNCTNNTNGAVLVNIVSKTTPPTTPAVAGETLPNATAPGVPANSYGFIRFRAVVK
ncbi:DUF11 domain-containing protein [Dolichospermum sp. UHCC 0259]|uniref:DUF11 domain-containing protein n=1 Tax=Dolichospermum sp. UHCC 0259 TaxID=2590010 RepID=UPI001445A531|nr:DUF11 domain-containing protein [Dolichospermum sp. UHCC 0259]MTJ50284.1 DUF11 domain-containing protein [Dolichospermum sp. UHCC 0259]